MSLFVVSQSEKKLYQIDNLEQIGCFIATYIHGQSIDLAEYESEERCAEIFQAVIKHLRSLEFIQNPIGVYKFPKE